MEVVNPEKTDCTTYDIGVFFSPFSSLSNDPVTNS